MFKAPNRNTPGTAGLLLLFVFFTLGAARSAQAQGVATASKSADISFFGGYTRSDPDYGIYKNHGVTFGANYTHYFHWPVAPSFEARANYNTGTILDEKSMLFGLRLQGDVAHRFHPYGNVLVGATKVTFHILPLPQFPNYTSDTALALSIGGGVDIDIIRHFQAKVDFQEQLENFGPNATQPNNADFTLSPTALTIGVVYRIPFRPFKR